MVRFFFISLQMEGISQMAILKGDLNLNCTCNSVRYEGGVRTGGRVPGLLPQASLSTADTEHQTIFIFLKRLFRVEHSKKASA